ncbi:unnamed protein product [Rhizophagus irregularis]|nr:unnamed protein product [Rhizophagus irregularis]
MLCVIVVIDNHFKSRIVAFAIIEDETLDTFRWILMTLFKETDINPKIIFTDSDPSLISAIKEIYPNTNHLLCIFHIDLNLRKKLKESWAISWIHNQFTCDAQSTQRIESINNQIHDKINRSTSLCDLVININDYVKCEEHFEKFEIERNALPTVGLPMLHT